MGNTHLNSTTQDNVCCIFDCNDEDFVENRSKQINDLLFMKNQELEISK